ncbi:MAG: hypothetical protein M1428_04575 [Deltaproteobacteria bacterium]|nr:hypothetical protein [Deltaproteobacteria bacterium]
MNYKKIVVLCSVAMIASATVFSACSKKKKEEDITITLKTEGAIPAFYIYLIKRQKLAMITKNVPLALQDIAGNNDQNKRALEDYFNRYEKIDVNFSNISINVSGNTATAVMDQRTSIVTKSLIPQTITELTKVQWTFIEEDDRWLISGTQILSKMKDK